MKQPLETILLIISMHRWILRRVQISIPKLDTMVAYGLTRWLRSWVRPVPVPGQIFRGLLMQWVVFMPWVQISMHRLPQPGMMVRDLNLSLSRIRPIILKVGLRGWAMWWMACTLTVLEQIMWDCLVWCSTVEQRLRSPTLG